MNEKNMKRVDGLPPLTKEQQAELSALAEIPDSKIDTSDIPEWTDEDFAHALRLNGRSISDVMNFYRVKKAPIPERVDLDVLN